MTNEFKTIDSLSIYDNKLIISDINKTIYLRGPRARRLDIVSWPWGKNVRT